MQTEMGLRIHQMEAELERTNKKLGTFKLYYDSCHPKTFSAFLTLILTIKSLLIHKICTLPVSLFSTAQTEDDLKRVNQEKERIEKEKDDKIKELEIKINSMGLAYENVLNVSLLNFKCVKK